MSEMPPVDEAPIVPPKVDPETLVLRARPARAIRFKRGVVVSLAALAAGGVVVTSWFALEPRALHLATNPDDQPPGIKAPSDTLSSLPTSYGDAPKLGPPLPGDLGRPILDRQRQLATLPPVPPVATPGVDKSQIAAEARQRRLQELATARASGLMVQTASQAAAPAVGVSSLVEATPPDAAAKLEQDPSADPNGQLRNNAFADNASRKGDVNPNRVAAAPSPYTLSAGSVIAASLITGLRSDLPGMVTAQVTQRVYDSATGTILLVPQGARLIGTYDSVVAFGQSRALVIWQRIVFPDGSSIQIGNTPASDPSGYAGLADKVDFHTWTLLKGIVLSTMLGVGAELQFSGRGDLVDALRQSAEQNVSRAGDQLTSRNLNVQPTITVRPGATIRLLVHQDLVLKPWREE
ncbi:MAG: TrbI/VirB10 family protein [Sphingomonas sp.]|uniref:TrbI/VirB10 family protein n=1 Tax=Sphingomonas sp. TaxID=28214 RepID=UPI001AC2C123|nr:TrbI/VirB10 family protein [Sphingomonas sp.]MBN8807964.1 TrbI/VirB10 family protein [Sphingomonas sp.]